MSVIYSCLQVTGIYGSGVTRYPCTKCVVPQENSSNIDKTYKHRNEKDMKKINKEIRLAMISENASAKKLCSLSSMYSAYGVDVSEKLMFTYHST